MSSIATAIQTPICSKAKETAERILAVSRLTGEIVATSNSAIRLVFSSATAETIDCEVIMMEMYRIVTSPIARPCATIALEESENLRSTPWTARSTTRNSRVRLSGWPVAKCTLSGASPWNSMSFQTERSRA